MQWFKKQQTLVLLLYKCEGYWIKSAPLWRQFRLLTISDFNGKKTHKNPSVIQSWLCWCVLLIYFWPVEYNKPFKVQMIRSQACPVQSRNWFLLILLHSIIHFFFFFLNYSVIAGCRLYITLCFFDTNFKF